METTEQVPFDPSNLDTLHGYPKEEQIDLIFSLFPNYSEEEKKQLLRKIHKERKVKQNLFCSNHGELIHYLLESTETLDLYDLSSFVKYAVTQENPVITAQFLAYRNQHYAKEEVQQFEDRQALLAQGFELFTFSEFSHKWLCRKEGTGITISGYLGTETSEYIPHHVADGTEIRVMESGDYPYIQSWLIEADLEECDPFFRNEWVESVILTGKLKKLPCFEDCCSLESITLPDSLTEIRDSAFASCTALSSITLPHSVTVIEDHAFYGCTALSSITLPDSITMIEDSTFYGCTSLTSITLSDSLTEIGRSAFESCTSLTSLTLPNSLTEIGRSAFSRCKLLESITLPNSLTQYQESYKSEFGLKLISNTFRC